VLSLECSDARTADFDYELPQELIAQAPAEPRDAARLMVVDRRTGRLAHRIFAELDQLLTPNDLLVANRTRVMPARLVGQRVDSGGRAEALLLRQTNEHEWEALVRPGRRLQPGALVEFAGNGNKLVVEVGSRLPGGQRRLRVAEPRVAAEQLLALGQAPLPPYVDHWSGEFERYQTVYADRPGSAAAPTAGLHFTPGLLARVREAGVGLKFITLHIGPDTFRPIRVASLACHQMGAEWAEVGSETMAAIRRARQRGGRVVAVGTTTVRALESVAARQRQTRTVGTPEGGRADIAPGRGGWSGWTRLFIQPGHRFRWVDAMITNFHLPRSTLLVLVSAFAGRERIMAAYQAAVEQEYRFYSFGDAMLLV
jgi:S-adenosylmethionine:tRNA ribosyltransferase-isomerase